MSASSNPNHQFHNRIGGWLPQNHALLESWLARRIALMEADARHNEPLHPVIHDFRRFKEEDPVIYMGFNQMFEQAVDKPCLPNQPTTKPAVRDYMTMLKLFNHVIKTAPPYEDDDIVILPMYAILYRAMGTSVGLWVLSDPRVNAQFKKMFDVWAGFLSSPESRYVLTTADDGWLGPKAAKKIPDFATTFECDPTAEYYGFASWDDFFTRRFRPGVRPVASPDDPSVITNACESYVYRTASDVREHDRFWLKGEPYSLRHMLNNDTLAGQFAGGTVYQATLSATNYHRWHSPVDGRIIRITHVPGAYFAEFPAVGSADNPEVNNSQAFATAVAARAIIYIEADNADVGLMCFMTVGLVEVSTCEVTVRECDRVKKGDQLGLFHFGGSTYCLLFRPQTRVVFTPGYPPESNIPLNAAIATVSANPLSDRC